MINVKKKGLEQESISNILSGQSFLSPHNLIFVQEIRFNSQTLEIMAVQLLKQYFVIIL